MGWVLDARSSHQPSALSALTPSMAVNAAPAALSRRADLVGDLELTLIRAGEADLRRAHRARQGRPLSAASERPSPAISRSSRRGGIERIVESVVAVGEEDVAAHLPGERCAHLGHLRLDRRVARAPHQGRAAEAGDFVEQDPARLDVADDGGTRPFAQYLAGEQGHELIAPKDLAGSVHDSDSVAIAIEGDAEFAALGPHGIDQLRQVLRHRGIRMVGGKSSVDRSVQQDMTTRETVRERAEHRAGGAVAGIPTPR